MITDDFNRADNADLGSAWDSGYSAGFGSCQIVSNAMRASALSIETAESNNSEAVVADQYAQVTIGALGGVAQIGVILRAAVPPTCTMYWIIADATGSIVVRKRVAGVETNITSTAATWTAGDIIRAEIKGQTIDVFKNGVHALRTSDTSIASGRPGVYIFPGVSSLADGVVDNFQAGSLITYFGSASVPADGVSATNATATLTITPPGAMAAGDLVAVICMSRLTTTWSNGVTGGQTWTALTAYAGTGGPYCRIFWCQFNGTWAANPRFDSTDATCTSAIMHVFRPYNSTMTWAIDVAQAAAAYAAATTVTRAGVTTAHGDAIVMACWHSLDDNTWGTVSSNDAWALLGSGQYRNTSSNDMSASFVYSPAATILSYGNVSLTQLTNGPDAGCTAILAWYASAGGAALTKSLADGLTLNDVRSGIAQYIRGLPDALTMNEVFSRLAQYQRYSVDALTMSESISAVKALMRAFIDPLTLGENLVTTKALLRAYADALILGELVDRQIILAAYSDNFNRADSSTPGASWNENVTGVSIVSNRLAFTNNGAYSSVVWTLPVAVSCQYQIGTWTRDVPDADPGMMFRCSNTTNGSCYQITWNTSEDLVQWYNVPNMTAPATGTLIQQATLSTVVGDEMGVTLEGTGNNTVVRIWKNPTGLPIRADNWNGDTTPNVTFTNNPTTPRDAGTFLGLFAGPWGASNYIVWEDWFGGSCLESTGILWTKDLFDGLVLGEALATLATLLRANADPIVLAEAMTRAAALQRYAIDSLSIGENVAKARALARSYLEVLTLGEAFAKRAGKLFADALTLGEAFAKQLQAARALADPVTVGEALAKQMQFRRTQIDTIAMGENLTIPLQGVKGLADALTMAESLARVMTHRRSLADLVTMGETLDRRISRALADLVAMNEAVAKLFGKNIANPITLSELVAKQKQIGKAVADVIAMSEVLTKIFVGIKNLADPLVLGETVSKQLLGAFTRSLADSITMATNAFTQAQYLRSLADPISLSEALAKQAQFHRSLADLVTLGEALQKVVVLVRSISNTITMGETVAKSAAFARSRVDPLTLNEALSKLLGIARSLADSMTLGDALAKSATFRRAMADVIALADTGTRIVLRQLLADSITMADVVVRTKIFLRFYADPLTMGDAVTKLFVLLRIFSDSLSLGEQLARLAAFHRLPVDVISLAEVLAKVAAYKRSAADPLNLGEALNGISAFRIAAYDLLDLGEAFQATGILEKTAADAITLADVIDTKFVIFDEAWARRPYNIGTGGVPCP